MPHLDYRFFAPVSDDVFSEMPGGRPSSFQGVTEWEIPWRRSAGAGNREGGDLPAIWQAGLTRP